jgi:serine/threonine protein kinase
MQNILIKSQPPDHWWVKIADFGISKRAEQENCPSTIKGTLEYMAPELLGFGESSSTLDSNGRQQAADMWALGEITFRMLTGERSFKDLRTLGDYCEGKIEFPSAKIILCAGVYEAQFTEAIMEARPENRLRAEDALKHVWMSPTTGVNDPGLLVEPTKVKQVGSRSASPSFTNTSYPTLTTEPSAKWTEISEDVSTGRMTGRTESNKTHLRDVSQPERLLTPVRRRASSANLHVPNTQLRSQSTEPRQAVELPRGTKKYPPPPTVEDYQSEDEGTIRPEASKDSISTAPAAIHSETFIVPSTTIMNNTDPEAFDTSSHWSPPLQDTLSSNLKGKAVEVPHHRKRAHYYSTNKQGSGSKSSDSDSWESEDSYDNPYFVKTKIRQQRPTEWRLL